MEIKNWFIYNRVSIVAMVLLLGVLVLVQCAADPQNSKTDSIEEKPMQYAGSESCEGCHKDIFQAHIKTAHFSTSQIATESSIMGSLESPENSFRFNDNSVINVEKAEAVYQVAFVNGVEVKRQNIDVIFGAGKHAQSFASWVDNKLVQLPLTYFTAFGKWSNSPGYPDKIVFNRVITARCMECHSTLAEVKSKEGNVDEFNSSTVLYGINCEKCHGPAASHVKYQTQNPADTIGKYIISTKSFTREQKIDMCAVCHSGTMTELKPAFNFKSGDKLSDFYAYNIVAPDVESLDVHGNQYGVLSMSQCFMKSDMTCTSCHNIHANESGQKKVFSQRCITCHNRELKSFCTIKNTSRVALEENCIDCHMPAKPSSAIQFSEQENLRQTGISMRTHFIKVYPEEAKKMMKYINGSGN